MPLMKNVESTEPRPRRLTQEMAEGALYRAIRDARVEVASACHQAAAAAIARLFERPGDDTSEAAIAAASAVFDAVAAVYAKVDADIDLSAPVHWMDAARSEILDSVHVELQPVPGAKSQQLLRIDYDRNREPALALPRALEVLAALAPLVIVEGQAARIIHDAEQALIILAPEPWNRDSARDVALGEPLEPSSGHVEATSEKGGAGEDGSVSQSAETCNTATISSPQEGASDAR